MTSTPVLEAQDLSVGYGGQPVVRGLNLTVSRGEVVALLGANGAGKTTALLGLCGELRATSGSVLLAGQPTSQPLHKRARKGLAYVSEERSVFRGLSTADNLRVGSVEKDDVLTLFPELARRVNTPAGLLSGGEQQMLTVGRALARRPSCLIADELSLGLAPIVVTRLLEAVRAAADEWGTGVLIVEQHVRKALVYADRAYVMQRGKVVLSGPAAEIASRADEIERTYFGSSTAV